MTTIKSIYSKLLNFNNDEIEFEKSKSPKQINDIKDIFGFIDCQVGDPVYRDDELGYNLVNGELIGYCVIPAGTIDNKPHFAYKKVITDANGEQRRYKWTSAKTFCEKFRNKFGDFNFYCPTYKELCTAYKLAYGNGFNIDTSKIYWSSELYNSGHNQGAFVLMFDFTGEKILKYSTIKRSSIVSVIPFFTIPEKEK